MRYEDQNLPDVDEMIDSYIRYVQLPVIRGDVK